MIEPWVIPMVVFLLFVIVLTIALLNIDRW